MLFYYFTLFKGSIEYLNVQIGFSLNYSFICSVYLFYFFLLNTQEDKNVMDIIILT